MRRAVNLEVAVSSHYRTAFRRKAAAPQVHYPGTATKREDAMKNLGFGLTAMLGVALAVYLGAWSASASAQRVIVGIDTKVFWDENGKPIFSPPGKDSVTILDISHRLDPKILASLPLVESVFRPPVNLAI